MFLSRKVLSGPSWLLESLLSTRTSHPSPQSCFPIGYPKPVLVPGVFFPRCRNLHLHLLNFRCFFSGQLSNLLRSFWRATQPSGVGHKTNLVRRYSFFSLLAVLFFEPSSGPTAGSWSACCPPGPAGPSVLCCCTAGCHPECVNYFLSMGRTLHFPFLLYIRLLLVQFSSSWWIVT